MHTRADMKPVTHGPNSGKCACVNVELDEHPAGSTRYNTRARIDLQFVCNRVEPAGSTRYNARAQVVLPASLPAGLMLINTHARVDVG